MKPRTWRVTITVAVAASLLLGLAGLIFGIVDLSKINNVNDSITRLNASIASVKVAAAVPAATMIVPTNGATVSGTVYVDAAPAGPSPTSVIFVASGLGSTRVQIATGKLISAGWASQWKTTNTANGTYQIAAVAYNAEGKSTTSPAVTVTVKNP